MQGVGSFGCYPSPVAPFESGYRQQRLLLLLPLVVWWMGCAFVEFHAPLDLQVAALSQSYQEKIDTLWHSYEKRKVDEQAVLRRGDKILLDLVRITGPQGLTRPDPGSIYILGHPPFWLCRGYSVVYLCWYGRCPSLKGGGQGHCGGNL